MCICGKTQNSDYTEMQRGKQVKVNFSSSQSHFSKQLLLIV